MPIRRERNRLMAKMWLILLIILGTVLGSVAKTDEATNGATSGDTSAVAVHSHGRRRLQTTYEFATQLEMTVCLKEDHTSDSASLSGDEFKAAVMEVLDLTNSDYVKVDTALTVCTVDEWQRRISVFNEAEDDRSAADVASSQVDTIYVDPGTQVFFEDLSKSINKTNTEYETSASDFDLHSLGFLVIWLDADGDVVSTLTTSESKDVVSIGGTDVWWPWWAWLIYAGVVVCCICPMLFFFFRWRKDKGANDEGYPEPQKSQPPASAASVSSSNPQGTHFAEAGGEYKGGGQ